MAYNVTKLKLNVVFFIDKILFFVILQKSVVKMINKILFYTT